MSNAEPVLLDPPDWPGLSNDQLTVFTESVNGLLDFGIFRPPLAAEARGTTHTWLGRWHLQFADNHAVLVELQRRPRTGELVRAIYHLGKRRA